jgi:hypothetical protein
MNENYAHLLIDLYTRKQMFKELEELNYFK